MKCLEKHRERRYETANALARDIQRYLADEAVEARPPSAGYRFSKFVRRHKGQVIAASLVLLALLGGLAAVAAVQSVANTRLAASLDRETNANKALAAANSELTRSRAAVQARYDLAVEAIKTFHTGVSEDFLLKEDQFKNLRDRLLKSASDFYGKLGALLGKESDLTSRRALWQANYEVAELTGKVGTKEDALAAHRQILAAREALAAEPGAQNEVKADVGRSLTAIAWLLFWSEKTDEALAAYRGSESLLAGLAGSDPSVRAALADCRARMARLLRVESKDGEGLAAAKLARADQEALTAVPGASNEARRDLANTVDEIGSQLWAMGKVSEAEPKFRTALEIQQKLADDNPTVTDFRDSLANSHTHLGEMLSWTVRLAEAEAEMRTAAAIHQKLADEYPAVTKFRRNLAVHRQNLGSLLLSTGSPSEGEAQSCTARSIHQKLGDEYPTVTDYRSVLASNHLILGYLRLQMGKPEEAEAEYRAALAIYQKLAEDNPSDTYYRNRLALSQESLGALFLQMRKPLAAEAECRTALAISQKLADDNPAVFPNWLAYALVNLGDVVRLLSGSAEAKGCYERALTLTEPEVAKDPTNKFSRYVLAGVIWRRGLTLRNLGAMAEASANVRWALALCDGLPPRSECDYETACCNAALAALAGRDGSGVSTAEGEAAAAKAMDYLGRMVSIGYRNANEITTESAFDPLRSRDDFRLLMMDLALPAEPFAE